MHATNLSAPAARAAVSGRIPRMLMAVLGPLAALGLLLSLPGCGTTAAATTSVTGPTPAGALRIFNAYVTAEKVALANHDELLALSLLTGSQYNITNAAYTAAAATGRTVGGPVYGPPTLYVPKLTTYPQWFMAAAPERPATGGPVRTALLVFDRLSAETTWALSGSVLLNPGTARTPGGDRPCRVRHRPGHVGPGAEAAAGHRGGDARDRRGRRAVERGRPDRPARPADHRPVPGQRGDRPAGRRAAAHVHLGAGGHQLPVLRAAHDRRRRAGLLHHDPDHLDRARPPAAHARTARRCRRSRCPQPSRACCRPPSRRSSIS